MSGNTNADHKFIKKDVPTYESMQSLASRRADEQDLQKNVTVDCGWGRVIMGHTFEDPKLLAALMSEECRGKRDIALYVSDPHVVLSYAPQTLFLDPSHTMRLDLITYRPHPETQHGVFIRRLQSESDAQAINHLYLKRKMVPSDPDFIWSKRSSKKIIYLVAEDRDSGQIIGTVMGINHVQLFNDPTRGSGLWCLAVDPQARRPGVGEALVRYLAEYFKARHCAFMDLSVMHDNTQAAALYGKIGFERFRTFAIKNKNAFNEALFIGPDIDQNLNPYAKIIVDEARARGISVEIVDAEEGYFKLSRGGKSVNCRESLCDLTSAVAMSRCQDKFVTHRFLRKIGLKTPEYTLAGDEVDNLTFLEKHKSIVVKPCNGEQGLGITVGVTGEHALHAAIDRARRYGDRVMLETYHPGQDLRIVVIGYKVVAAAVRRPARITGDGSNNVLTLIEKQSRRRQAATGGESRIPIDDETERCIKEEGYNLQSVLPQGKELQVRKTANLHTGGTIHDVTSILHPRLVDAATRAAKQLEIPVVGFDFMVKSPDNTDYVIIEANERVGLANHEPQPTAQRFLDLLFPLSVSAKSQREPVIEITEEE